MLSHILTPDQLGCAFAALPFAVLCAAFIAHSLAMPASRVVRVLRKDKRDV